MNQALCSSLINQKMISPLMEPILQKKWFLSQEWIKSTLDIQLMIYKCIILLFTFGWVSDRWNVSWPPNMAGCCWEKLTIAAASPFLPFSWSLSCISSEFLCLWPQSDKSHPFNVWIKLSILIHCWHDIDIIPKNMWIIIISSLPSNI